MEFLTNQKNLYTVDMASKAKWFRVRLTSGCSLRLRGEQEVSGHDCGAESLEEGWQRGSNQEHSLFLMWWSHYSYEILEGFPGMLCSHPFKKSYEQTKKSTCEKFFALNSVLLLFLSIKRWRLMNTIVRCACFLVRATFGWGQTNAYERIRSTDIREKMKSVKRISCCW